MARPNYTGSVRVVSVSHPISNYFSPPSITTVTHSIGHFHPSSLFFNTPSPPVASILISLSHPNAPPVSSILLSTPALFCSKLTHHRSFTSPQYSIPIGACFSVPPQAAGAETLYGKAYMALIGSMTNVLVQWCVHVVTLCCSLRL